MSVDQNLCSVSPCRSLCSLIATATWSIPRAVGLGTKGHVSSAAQVYSVLLLHHVLNKVRLRECCIHLVHNWQVTHQQTARVFVPQNSLLMTHVFSLGCAPRGRPIMSSGVGDVIVTATVASICPSNCRQNAQAADGTSAVSRRQGVHLKYFLRCSGLCCRHDPRRV